MEQYSDSQAQQAAHERVVWLDLSALIIVGGLQGLPLSLWVFWADDIEDSLWLIPIVGLLTALLTFSLLPAKGARRHRYSLTLIIGLCIGSAVYGLVHSDARLGVLLTLSAWLGCALYAAWAFAQHGLLRGWRDWDYSLLFERAWNNILIIFVAQVLVGLFWGLVALWSALFSLLGLGLFVEFFYDPWVWPFLTCVFFAIGLHVGYQRGRVVSALRSFLLGLCRYLLPLNSAAILLMVVSLALGGWAVLWSTGSAAYILLSILLVQLWLLNGVFQTGHEAQPLPRWATLLVNISLWLAPVLAALAVYGLCVRIMAYGLTPLRALGLSAALLLALYALAAAWAALRNSGVWLASLICTNRYLAWLSIALWPLMWGMTQWMVVNEPTFAPYETTVTEPETPPPVRADDWTWIGEPLASVDQALNNKQLELCLERKACSRSVSHSWVLMAWQPRADEQPWLLVWIQHGPMEAQMWRINEQAEGGWEYWGDLAVVGRTGPNQQGLLAELRENGLKEAPPAVTPLKSGRFTLLPQAATE